MGNSTLPCRDKGVALAMPAVLTASEQRGNSQPCEVVSSPVVLGLNLAFSDTQLESDYCAEHNKSQLRYDLYLSVGIRCLGWIGTAIKAVQRGYPSVAANILYTALPSGLLPCFGMGLGMNFYLKYRPIIIAITNALQFYQTALFYGHLYPYSGVPIEEYTCCSIAPSSRAWVAVISANGTMFLILTTLMGSLTFKWLFITQYLYFMILILNNRRICLQSPPLMQFYGWLHEREFLPGVERVWRHLCPQHALEKGVYRVSTGLSTTLDACVIYQMALQGVFGLLLPCAFAFAREKNIRHAFLKARIRDQRALLPSNWEFFLYIMPALTFPWAHVALAEMNNK